MLFETKQKINQFRLPICRVYIENEKLQALPYSRLYTTLYSFSFGLIWSQSEIHISTYK
ncbi:hypothetical protein J538_1820 [Acinetobacter sp. 272263]|nr:hypothetical protein J538_1820 [Acinetobacter sp. 272263]EXE59982.1 hypothetical protein J579_0749 [Acinetobacter sp. 1239920]